MGCFLACFGFSKKRRKRRKPANKVSSGDQGHGSYKPLDSDVIIRLANSESEFSKGKERSSQRIKKKVSFNLNVKAYEPLPNADFTSYFSESEEEKCEENKEETEKAINDTVASQISTYPPNYRYQNCRDSYDEEDDIKLEEIDVGDEEYDGDSDDDDGDDGKITSQEEEFSEKLYSLPMESEKSVGSLEEEIKKLGLNSKAPRDRSHYVFSVLNPIENLTQWRAVKASRATPSLKKQREENKTSVFNYKPIPNQSKPIIQDIAVDASLSNWLVSSKTGPITPLD